MYFIEGAKMSVGNAILAGIFYPNPDSYMCNPLYCEFCKLCYANTVLF